MGAGTGWIAPGPRALCGRSGHSLAPACVPNSACCTKTARRASVGVRAANVVFSAAEWGDSASRAAPLAPRGDRLPGVRLCDRLTCAPARSRSRAWAPTSTSRVRGFTRGLARRGFWIVARPPAPWRRRPGWGGPGGAAAGAPGGGLDPERVVAEEEVSPLFCARAGQPGEPFKVTFARRARCEVQQHGRRYP